MTKHSSRQTLLSYGWTPDRDAEFLPYLEQGLEPARVVCELRRKFYALQSSERELLGQCPGKFFHNTLSQSEFPAIGDWVVIKKRPNEARAEIHAILPRHTKFSRRAAGDENIEQVIATNINTLFLVSSLDRTLNLARIQRFLVAASESGAASAIILNKSDLCPDSDSDNAMKDIRGIAPDIPLFLTSAKTRRGLKALSSQLGKGSTVAFIGTSGVGKSSLINKLLGEQAMPTFEVREKDSKGRHTTTRRELILTPSGTILIDTPGMRELQLWGVEEGLRKTFSDIIQLTLQCKFTNCTHQSEPGCAIKAALQDGSLSSSRWQDYQKLSSQDSKPTSKKPIPNNRNKFRKLAKERDEWKKHIP